MKTLIKLAILVLFVSTLVSCGGPPMDHRMAMVRYQMQMERCPNPQMGNWQQMLPHPTHQYGHLINPSSNCIIQSRSYGGCSHSHAGGYNGPRYSTPRQAVEAGDKPKAYVNY